LPQQGVEGFEKIFGTPHNRDLAKIVSGFGISNEVVTSAKELHIALQRIHPTLHVIVAKMPSRDVNALFLQTMVQNYGKAVSSSRKKTGLH
jgi:2-succinyl-5-enolpyruvyl-6-hydroxy-3-cyclohexene-1-carboxylate synthase